MITISLFGAKELREDLKQLKKLLSYKSVMARAARSAFRPVYEAARAKAPVDTGLLRRRIKMRTVTPSGGETVVAVGLVLGRYPKSLRGKSRPEARNWAWYERGIPTRGIPPRPFIRPALEDNSEQVVKLFNERLVKEIEKALRGKK